MPKKKTHRKAKHKTHHQHSGHSFGPDVGGHHARLRKLYAGRSRSGHSEGNHASHASHHQNSHKKAKKHHAKPRKSSALMERLRSAAAGAREQIKSFGRRKTVRQEQPVTEQTLRNHMALKCVRRCSH